MNQTTQLTLALPLATGRLSWWQWHGRQVFAEMRNDFRFSRKMRCVVYRLDDVCKASDEVAARLIFEREYPDAQEIALSCIGPVMV